MKDYKIRNAHPQEFAEIGQLLVSVYSELDGFPKIMEQPAYYEMLANIGEIEEKPGARVLVAVTEDDQIGGAVVYFGDMAHYDSGGTATQEKNAAGFRLLAVDPEARGNGLGKILTQACIDQAKMDGATQVIIHSTEAMKVAWKMYEKMGFQRSEDLDFEQKGFPVFGFRLKL